MKIINSIRQVYDEQLLENNALKVKIDSLFTDIKEGKWHYTSRVKSLPSFALKIETGRFTDPSALEDFFACVIVVENIGAINRAKKLLKTHFKIIEERPKNQKVTEKESHSFIFDDLRLFVKLKPTAAELSNKLNEIIFEVQIKTFLQHAWEIATHDLIYKSDQINWSKQRVAYQIKAMLENAEVSIEKAGSIKSLKGLPKKNPSIDYQNEIKAFLTRHFELNQLPKDLVRLVGNLLNLITVLKIDLIKMEKCLVQDTAQGKGVNTLNLSPHLIIVQSLINHRTSSVVTFLKKKPKTNNNLKLFLPREVDVSKIARYLPNNDNIIR